MQVLQFIAGIGIGYLAYQAALFVTGYLVTRSTSIGDFIHSLLAWTYSMIVTVFASYALLGSLAWPYIGFAMAHAITLCMIDFEATYDTFQDL